MRDRLTVGRRPLEASIMVQIHVPQHLIHVPPMNRNKLKKNIFELLLRNRRTSGEYQYTVPSPQTYPYQWLWDSCFHVIIFSACDYPKEAKKELLSLVSHQFKNGMLPHMIYWDKGSPTDFPKVKWGKKDTSTITQPPMIAYAAWQIYQHEGDKNFLKGIYEQLKKFYQYLIDERKGEDDLIGIINPDESGEDNSPRFDEPLGLPQKHTLEENFGKRLELVGKNKSCNFETKECMSNFFWVKDVPFNVITVENLSKLSEIASILGNTKDKKYFLEQSDLVANAMKKWMFWDGIFCPVYGKEHKKIKVKTWAIFAPLFAKLYTQKEAQMLVKNFLLDKNKFNLNFIVPTVSKDDPSFDPEAPIREDTNIKRSTLSWRGPIWMAINWFIYKGLMNYGFKKEATMVLQSSLSLLEKSGFREYYHPKSGEGMGAKQFSWGGLVLDMFE